MSTLQQRSRSLAVNDKLKEHLIDAVERGDFKDVTETLTDTAFKDEYLDSILGRVICESCQRNQPHITKLLLDTARQVSKRLPEATALKALGEDRSSPLIIALKCKLTETVAVLIDGGAADPGAVDAKGRNALTYCREAASIKQILEICPQNKKNLINAKDETGTTAFMWIIRNVSDEDIALHLINTHVVDLDAQDNDGRTALITAIWKNCLKLIRSLATPTRVNAVDHRSRNALHHLAADVQRAKVQNTSTDASILDILVKRQVSLDAIDALGRTPLALALLNGNCGLASLFLKANSDVKIESNAGWNMLHMACNSQQTSKDMVEELRKRGLDVNKPTGYSQKLPVHIAAESGNLEILEYLLQEPTVKRHEQDIHGNTPLFYAARLDEGKRRKIGKVLAPWHEWTTAHLQKENNYPVIKAATDVWKATVIDFDPNNSVPNLLKHYSIYNLINKRQAPDNEAEDLFEDSEPFFRTRPQKGRFRWIHLPANNISWCRDLIAKIYVERDCSDTQGFRELEKTLNNQHRGHERHLHSRYMTPTCQWINSPPTYANRQSGVGIIGSRLEKHGSSGGWNDQPMGTDSLAAKDRPDTANDQANDQNKNQNKDETNKPPGHVFMFMPYLHYEKYKDMLAMEHELDKMVPKVMNSLDARGNWSVLTNSGLERAKEIENIINEPQEKLFKAYLQPGSVSLHTRRTLDQSFYHNLTTKYRDRDQVVYRYQKRTKINKNDRKILMVDQLWMWIIAEDLVLTSFPRCWKGGVNDGSDMLQNAIEGIMNMNSESIGDVYQLAMAIASHFQGTNAAQGHSSEELRALEIFAAEIGNAMDREVKLFKKFKHAAAEANDSKRHNDSGHKFNKTLLDIKDETELLTQVKDIRDELGMLKVLFQSQEHIVESFRAAIDHMYPHHPSSSPLKQMNEQAFEAQKRNVGHALHSVRAMDRQIGRVYESIRDLLNLKQKHVNAVEARLAGEQAVSASRSAKTLMLFTIITVIFLPFSFVAAFFAIPIATFNRDGGDGDKLAFRYVAKYMLGIASPVAAGCVAIALSVGPSAPVLREYSRRIWLFWNPKSGKRDDATPQWHARFPTRRNKLQKDEQDEQEGIELDQFSSEEADEHGVQRRRGGRDENDRSDSWC